MAITETRTRPPQFIEDIGVDLAQNLVASTGVPTVSVGLTGISQRPGEDPKDFAARQQAARQFETRQQSLAGLAPTVAGQDALQLQAAQLAGSGVGSYQPFINQAQQLTGAGGGTGAGSIQEYMSPYQTQVIDASLAEFDRNAASNRQRIRDQAVASGAFGGGREGVAMAEYDKASDMNRAQLQAGLLNQGFMDARQARGADLAAQQGLGTYQQQLGSAQQGFEQAKLDAGTLAAREAEFEPFTRLGLVGQQLAQIQPGAFPTTTIGYQQGAAPASPMASFLGGAAGAGGVLGKLGIFG